MTPTSAFLNHVPYIERVHSTKVLSVIMDDTILASCLSFAPFYPLLPWTLFITHSFSLILKAGDTIGIITQNNY